MIRFAAPTTLVIGLALLAARPAAAQSEVLFRLAPEAGWLSAEHSKRVTAGGGSSESATTASGATLSLNPSLGLRTRVLGGLLAGLEFEGVLAGRGKIEGTIEPTPNGEPHDVWPGEWDLRDRFGLGTSVLLGIGPEAGSTHGYVFGGIRRMWSEFATGGVDPATGEAGERREQRARWPTSIGIGLTLNRQWLVDLRLAYSRSLTEWTVEIPDVLLDYGYSASAVTLSVGIGPPR
ncbi:MAG: hypothetical protein F4037_01575 [Gemmatimonadales bacterium]|nr:hypothetical protein [Gemmatimonadales bacterium]MYK00640.1 hypothetical protein [Candidatus Palauibacter ramosifaciens]